MLKRFRTVNPSRASTLPAVVVEALLLAAAAEAEAEAWDTAAAAALAVLEVAWAVVMTDSSTSATFVQAGAPDT